MLTDLSNLNFILIRCLMAFIFSLIFSIFGIKYLIFYLKANKNFQPIRAEGPIGHLIVKQKTPTMGGIIACIALLFSGLFFCNLKDNYVQATLIISLSFGAIGLIDDVIKVFYKNTNGFRGSIKLILQLFICSAILLWLIYNGHSALNDSKVFIPFFKTALYIGILYLPFAVFVIVGSSNAVNLTDGLDGLAIVPIIFCTLALGGIALISNYNIQIIQTLNPDNVSELSILCSSIIGSGIAFFAYNKYPAKIIMGDVGSLMYGAFLGCIAVMIKYEIFYGIIGLLFVIEAMSVIIQVTGHFFFGKKIFKMAPLHHHFEKSGWSERKVILNFWLFSLICIIIGFLGIINF